jgi:hypothetical protein
VFDAEQITRDVIDQVRRYMTRLMQQSAADAMTTIPNFEDTPLEKAIRLLVRVANGDFPADMADEDFSQDVEAAITMVTRVLFTSPGSPRDTAIPAQFWQGEMGSVIRHCQLWLRGDDLITFSEAAEMLFPGENVQAARMRIKRMVERGELVGYSDPSERNPQKAARVSRQEAEQYRT